MQCMYARIIDPLPTDYPGAAGFELWRRARIWRREVDAALAPLKLTHTEYWVLACAERLMNAMHEEPTQCEIANYAGMHKAAVSTVLRRLERRGLLGRDITGAGPASLLVFVPEHSQRLLQEAAPRLERISRRLAGLWNPP